MSIILHILCRNIGFSKRGTAPLKGGVRHVEMHTAFLQRAWCNFSMNTYES